MILRFQIRGTWKRQADRVGDVQQVRDDSTKPARVLNKKSSAKFKLRARIAGAGFAVRLCETHQPAAEHWRFVRVFERDREAVDGKVGCSAVAFFSDCARRPGFKLR